MEGVEQRDCQTLHNPSGSYKGEMLVIRDLISGSGKVQSEPPGFPFSPVKSVACAANNILLQLNEDPGTSNGTESNSLDYLSPCTEEPEPSKLDETDAKRQLQLIFRTPTCWRSDSDQNHLLYLLKKFPVLASQFYDWDYNLFWEHGNEWSTPLCFLLSSGANLEAIQAVYSLYPKTISQPQGVHRDLPLHFACRYSAPDDVIAFIATEYPSAVTVPNSSGMLPLHCALGKKHAFPYGKFQQASLDVVKFILELYPESLLVEEKEKFYTPLQIAFNHGYSFEIIDYMMSRVPQGMNEFSLLGGCYHKLFSVHLDLAESELVSKLLPRLQRFRCEPTYWTVDGLVQLLRNLRSNTSIVKFDVLNIPVEILISDPVLKAVRDLLESNKTLQALCISVKEDDIDSSPFIRKFNHFLRKNQTIKSLDLTNFCLTASDLAVFLSQGRKPDNLKLHRLVITGEYPATDDIEDRTECTSPVKSLTISECRLKPEKSLQRYRGFLRVVKHAALMPLLASLTIQSSHLEGLDVTVPLVELLTGSKTIETLSVDGPDIDMELICHALRKNRTLRCLDAPATLDTRTKQRFLVEVLENHNAVLEYVRMSTSADMRDEDQFRSIQYFTRLNQYGRARAQDPKTEKATFVKMLQTFNTLSRVCRSEDKLAVQYGLLRETPSLWCSASGLDSGTANCHNGRKRKREHE